jgi:hypothetical protein
VSLKLPTLNLTADGDTAMKHRKQRAVILLCCLVMGTSGCVALIAAGAGAGAGVGTYSYIEGNLKRDYIGPPQKVWDSTLAALEELGVASNVKERDYFGGLIKAIMHDGTEVNIKLTRLTDNSTEVAVRVGVFGDREKSELIHDKIAEKFKKG